MAMPHAVHRFTADEYQRMGEVSIFHEDDRVELLDGEILAMSPIGGAHAACVVRLTEMLSRRVHIRPGRPAGRDRHATGVPGPHAQRRRDPRLSLGARAASRERLAPRADDFAAPDAPSVHSARRCCGTPMRRFG
jgi:Uma2 family endonuclease